MYIYEIFKKQRRMYNPEKQATLGTIQRTPEDKQNKNTES
jgi:hypothetical protein